MLFNLDRPIVFFDLESTGLSIVRDRVVQIALVKYVPGQEHPVEWKSLINPGIPIPAESTAVHGISDDDVADAPSFATAAGEIFSFIEGADLGGYNSNRFDVPMLMEELARVGYDLDLDQRRLVDVQRIFYLMEPRTLSAALRYYCGTALENAHDALADVRATVDVLKGMIERYRDTDLIDDNGGVIERPVRNDMQALYEFTYDSQMIDVTQKLRYDSDGNVVFNFGKHQHKIVGETLYKDREYYNWIMNKDFSHQVKKIVHKEVKEYIARKQAELNQME